MGEARLISVSADESLVEYAANAMLREDRSETEADPVIGALVSGKRKALRIIRKGDMPSSAASD